MNNLSIEQQINEITNYIKSKVKSVPEIGIILGTGLGNFVSVINQQTVIPYAQIPYLPSTTAPGHYGNLIFGEIEQKSVIVMQGRFHLYEGISPHIATILVRVMKNLGVKLLINTCASGGLNKNFDAGELLLVTDHINLTAVNPLTGENLENFGPRFPVMFDVYDHQFGDLLKTIALENKIKLHSGVYVGISGPCFCTRAESKFYSQIGADVIGMSLVQEVMVAAHSNIRVLAVATITDMALFYSHEHKTNEEMLLISRSMEKSYIELFTKFIAQVKF
ncbi:MAG: purine-nucleoside phosphorylase [Burkholderiales bacterium]|jgi:purine-nucleoside phosphorylase|nr:purine-nucleoside phosphorylase [Burkholderiales bacterium]